MIEKFLLYFEYQPGLLLLVFRGVVAHWSLRPGLWFGGLVWSCCCGSVGETKSRGWQKHSFSVKAEPFFACWFSPSFRFCAHYDRGTVAARMVTPRWKDDLARMRNSFPASCWWTGSCYETKIGKLDHCVLEKRTYFEQTLGCFSKVCVSPRGRKQRLAWLMVSPSLQDASPFLTGINDLLSKRQTFSDCFCFSIICTVSH